MNVQDIIIGRSYYDGKSGMRKVVSIEGSPLRVRYVILAAKVERQMNRDYEYVSVIGTESQCDLESFARWAKQACTESEAEQLLLSLRAAKVKLSPGEQAFIGSIMDDTGVRALPAGSMVQYDHTEGRAVSGLEKKGLVRRVPGGEVEILPLGAARLVQVAEAAWLE